MKKNVNVHFMTTAVRIRVNGRDYLLLVCFDFLLELLDPALQLGAHLLQAANLLTQNLVLTRSKQANFFYEKYYYFCFLASFIALEKHPNLSLNFCLGYP